MVLDTGTCCTTKSAGLVNPLSYCQKYYVASSDDPSEDLTMLLSCTQSMTRDNEKPQQYVQILGKCVRKFASVVAT